MLIGQFQSKITEKGRCAVPSKFRSETGDKLIVAKWYEQCLVMVGEKEWTALLDRLTGKTKFVTSPVRDTDRFILGSAFEIDLDDQGRFVIPRILKDYAKLSKNAVFVGLGDRIEIWDTGKWEQKEKEVHQSSSEMIEEIAKQNI